MSSRKLQSDVHFVGAIDWDRRSFDELIPLPEGTSYNAYLIQGDQKTALLDTVDPTKDYELINNLEHLGIKNIDLIISHHAEQDHSGSIPKILNKYANAKVVTNPKCKSMLMDLLSIPDDKFITVNDGETLSLGNKTLQFIYTPWVHWPETMSTYLLEDKILFSCDFFGSHLASSELFAKDNPQVYRLAKRYYAEIMMPFRAVISKNLDKLKDLDIKTIAPSHGPVYDEPKLILDAYRDWVSDKVKNEVVLPYVSMHGSTKKMVEYLVDALMQRGIRVEPFNLTQTDIGELAMALVDTATVVIASPTVLSGLHPSAAYAAFLTNALRPKAKFVSLIGSFGWGGKILEQTKALLGNLKAEILKPVLVKGYPKAEDLEKLDALADEIILKHKEHKLG
ncbi:MAG: FprA family A-type flavoprotein [Candidatus Zixiibacteriota bacterium]